MRETAKAEGAATLDDLEEFSAGLICLRVVKKDHWHLHCAGGEADARMTIDRLGSIYGRGNLYLELQRHQQREEECRNDLC